MGWFQIICFGLDDYILCGYESPLLSVAKEGGGYYALFCYTTSEVESLGTFSFLNVVEVESSRAFFLVRK